MLEGVESEPFRELLVHSSTTPALNTILGAGFRCEMAANLGSEVGLAWTFDGPFNAFR